MRRRSYKRKNYNVKRKRSPRYKTSIKTQSRNYSNLTLRKVEKLPSLYTPYNNTNNSVSVSKPFKTKSMLATKPISQKPLRCKERQKHNDTVIRSKVFKKGRSGGAISTQKLHKRERC